MKAKLFWITLILVIFGLIMLSSAGIVDGQKKFNDSHYYFKHQLIFGALPGLLLMLVLSRLNHKLLQKMAIPILLFSLVLMILVFIPGFSKTVRGATSWVKIFGYSFQPVEFLKLALVVYFSAWFSTRSGRMKNWAYGTAPFFVVLAIVAGLLVAQPDVGSLVMVAGMAMGMFFVAGGNLKHIGIIFVILAVVIGILIVKQPYRLDRVRAMIDPSFNPRGISYQLNQSMIAIGSGGIFGVGYGRSTQKFGFLPETIGDSIFAVIGEELGLVGTLGTIGLFLTLCLFLARIAKQSIDPFGRHLAVGVNIWIMSQALINIAAISGAGPLTGIPLPFISYGGTALMSVLMGIGIVMNVAKK